MHLVCLLSQKIVCWIWQQFWYQTSKSKLVKCTNRLTNLLPVYIFYLNLTAIRNCKNFSYGHEPVPYEALKVLWVFSLNLLCKIERTLINISTLKKTEHQIKTRRLVPLPRWSAHRGLHSKFSKFSAPQIFFVDVAWVKV